MTKKTFAIVASLIMYFGSLPNNINFFSNKIYFFLKDLSNDTHVAISNLIYVALSAFSEVSQK